MDAAELARSYYDAIDGDDYEALAELLAPEFVQVRGDRTFESREAFVRFMRDDRPDRTTTHEVDRVFERPGAVAVEGRLLRADGSRWFAFVDVFEVEDGLLSTLRTYTR